MHWHHITCVFVFLLQFSPMKYANELIKHTQIERNISDRVEDRLMNYLLAGELFIKTNHKPIDLHYKFNIFSIIFVPLFPVTNNISHL